MSNVRFIGLDVHAETIAVAAAEPTGEVRSVGVINRRASRLGHLRCCVLLNIERRGEERPGIERIQGPVPGITNELV